MALLLIGIVLIIAGAFGIYTGYSNADWTISGFAWAAILIGALVTLMGFGKRASAKMADQPDPEATDRAHIEVRALVQAMGVVAVADGKVRDQEVMAIAHLHEQMLGISISDAQVREILSEFGPDFDITSRLVADRSKISPTMKRLIVQSCHKVMVSDQEVARREENRINEIGLALGFDQTEIDDLIASAGT